MGVGERYLVTVAAKKVVAMEVIEVVMAVTKAMEGGGGCGGSIGGGNNG